MTDDLEPIAADGPKPEPEAWRKQYDPKAPLLASPAAAIPSEPAKTRSLWLAFLASAVVALLGGLVWAGIAIATNYDIGILALLIGAATGLAAHVVAGGPVGPFERGVAGLFAAAGLVVGKYVIFVHAVRSAYGTIAASQGVAIGYFSGHQISFFVHNFTDIVRPIYWLWIGLAAFAAVRTSGSSRVLGIGRVPS